MADKIQDDMKSESVDENQLTIDKFNLDEEWVKQASLVMEYSTLYADLTFHRDSVKDELAQEDGRLDIEIRSCPEDYGIEVKLTEAVVKSTIINVESRKNLASELAELNHKLAVVQGMKTALEHKKAALEKLTTLLATGYWSDPKIPIADQSEYEGNRARREQSAHLGNSQRNIGGRRHGKEE